MKDRYLERILVAWTALVAIGNIIYIPYLIVTTSAGEQAPLTFMALSVIVWVIVGGLLTIVFRIVQRMKNSR